MGVREAQLTPTQPLEEAMTGDLDKEVGPGKLPGRLQGGCEHCQMGEHSPSPLKSHSRYGHHFQQTPVPADRGNAAILTAHTRKLHSPLNGRVTNEISAF